MPKPNEEEIKEEAAFVEDVKPINLKPSEDIVDPKKSVSADELKEELVGELEDALGEMRTKTRDDTDEIVLLSKERDVIDEKIRVVRERVLPEVVKLRAVAQKLGTRPISTR